MQQGIRLLNVRQVGNQTKASVYIPNGKENYFFKKIEEYKDENTKKGNPKNANLVNSIEDISVALLTALWTDPPSLIPESKKASWVECWIRITDDEEIQTKEIESFTTLLQENDIETKPNCIIFPERAVVLINASREQLSQLIMICDVLAEFRIAQETCGFWINESNKDQVQWVKDLLSRLKIDKSNIKVCLLDSGVNNGHQLLQPFLAGEDCLTVDTRWGTDDHEAGSGHGTLMAGIVAFGDIEKAMLENGEISIAHKLCSVKILPRTGNNNKQLYGDITKQAVSRAEIQNPNIFVLYCMAVTALEDIDRGRPSSWSGAIDELAYGEGKHQRLIIISAGNVSDPNDWSKYPDINMVSSIQNPAQSWNALTIGAFTGKYIIQDPKFKGSQIVAPPGGLSPF